MDKLRRAFYILAVLAFIFLCSIIIIEFYNLGFIVAYIALYLPAGMTAVGIVWELTSKRSLALDVAVFIVYTIMMIAPVVLTSEMSIAILVSDGVWWAIAAIAITFAGMLAWYAAALAIFIRSIMEHRAKKCADGTAPHGAAEADRAWFI